MAESGDLEIQKQNISWVSSFTANSTRDANTRAQAIPKDIEDPALLDILCSHKVEIIDGVSAVILREAVCEVLIAGSAIPNLVHNYLLELVVHLVGYEAVQPLRLQLAKLQHAFVIHSDTRSRVCLQPHKLNRGYLEIQH